MSHTGEPVRPSEDCARAHGRLRRTWGLDNEEEEDPFKDDGRWMDGWMKDLRRKEEAKEEEKRKSEGITEEEEGVKPMVKNTEPQPSRKEIEEHMLTHIPFRSWCPHCVRGKARAKYHKGVKGEKHVPVISADYMYMESKESEDKGMPILVVKDRDSGWISARVVPKKGKHVYAIKEMSKLIDWMGYRRIIIKTDQEPAIMDLKECVKNERPEEIMFEESPAYDSRANGEVERAIQTVQGQLRAVKDAFEARYGHEMVPEDNIIPWMVAHAASLISRYHKGQDGLTAHRRLRGKEFRADVCEFGECVWYMKPGSVGKDKFDRRWEDGVWLGIVNESGENIIGTKEGCIKVRAVKRKPIQNRWDKDNMRLIRGVPWEVIPGHPERELKSRVLFERHDRDKGEQRMVDEPEEVIRRIYIRKQDLAKYGTTERCPGCRAYLRGGGRVRITRKSAVRG